MEDLKIGAVPFINVRPLIYTIENRVEFYPPSTLSTLMRSGYFDVSILPIVDYIKTNQYDLIPGLGIASNGPVQSVVLFYRGRLENLQLVTLDGRSLTSNDLLRVILSKHLNVFPHYQYPTSTPSHKTIEELGYGEGILLIGDDALIYPRGKDGIQSLDLGGEWSNWTRTPFVYAAWMVRQDLPAFTKIFIEKFLTGCLDQAMTHLEGLVREIFLEKNKEIPKALIHQYLSSCIHYKLGPKEQRGIEIFRKHVTGLGPLKTMKISSTLPHHQGIKLPIATTDNHKHHEQKENP